MKNNMKPKDDNKWWEKKAEDVIGRYDLFRTVPDHLEFSGQQRVIDPRDVRHH